MTKQKPSISGVANSNSQYVANSRLVNSEVGFTEKLKNFNSDLLRFRLSETKETKVFLPFDGSDLRKPSTWKSEKIDKVRSLGKTTINGYHSYNTIVVTEKLHQVSILEHKVFSTKEDDFLSKTAETLQLIESSSNLIKKLNPELQRIFIMDREFDNQRLFEDMDSRDDKFVIRCKTLNRKVWTDSLTHAQDTNSTNNINSTNNTLESNLTEENLDKIKFKNKLTKKIKSLKIKSNNFKDLTLKLQWQKVKILNKAGNNPDKYTEYTFIKALMLNDQKQPVFKSDKEFIIITNLPIESTEDVYQAYLNYFIRWKIEVVFKFLKDSLGLEQFRTPKLNAIRNLIALTFLIGAYLFELGEINIDDEFLIHLANLGDGKGQITPYYIRQGLAKLLNHIETTQYLKKLKPTDQSQLLSFVGGSRCVGV